MYPHSTVYFQYAIISYNDLGFQNAQQQSTLGTDRASRTRGNLTSVK